MPDSKRLKFIDLSGELIVELLKSSRSNLPKDTRAISVMPRVDFSQIPSKEYKNEIRILIESSEFEKNNEGGVIRQFDLSA